MALREVNLIPTEILSRRDLLRHLSLWGGCLILSLSLICGFYVYKNYMVLSKKHLLVNVGDINTDLGARIEEIKRIQQELEKLTHQQTILKAITKNQPYTRVFSKLAESMDESVWLTQLAIDGSKDEEGNPSMRLSGFSLTNEGLGNFLNRLSNEPSLKSVVLKYARETEKANSNEDAGESLSLIQFQIECNISRV